MTFSLWVWRFSIGVMDYSDLLVHDAVSTVNGFRCFEGTKNASWTTWALKMKAPRTFETSCALHPSRCSVVTSQKIGILDRFIVFLSAGSGPGKKKKNLRVPNMCGPASSTYTKSEILTLSCGGTWAGSKRANLYTWQWYWERQKRMQHSRVPNPFRTAEHR